MRHGFLFVNKPEGPTSHDIVASVRRSLPERKVGHLGTLDPAARGLLVLAVGVKALKVVELFTGLLKEYEADVCLGEVSATYDREGSLETFARKPGVEDPTKHAVLEEIRTRFLGHVDQVPPAASAVHIDGERAYMVMRREEEVSLPARTVEISECDILAYRYPHLSLRVVCSSGTYVRSLANDLGMALRTGGYLAGLRRTAVGDWRVEEAVDPEKVQWTNVVPLKDILRSRGGIELSTSQFEDIKQGRFIEGFCAHNTIAWYEDLPVALLEQRAIGILKARKVL